MTLTLEDRACGALVGAAVGDALGGPVEGWSPDQILERHGGRVHGIVGPWHEDWRTARPIAPYHKGDGHVTDDTLMTHALVRVYETVRDHLDAYAVADHLVPDLMTNPRWIPELEAEALPLQRIFLAEKWIVTRLHYAHADPREAGSGNIVNCGAAMYMAPVGIVNAGNPAGAYAEALDIMRRAPVLVRAGGGGRVRGGRGGRVRPRGHGRLGGGHRAVPREGRHARGRLRGVRSRLPPPGLRVGAGTAAHGGGPVRLGRPGLPRPLARRPPPVPPPLHRGTPGRPRHAADRGRGYETSVLGAVNYGRDCDSIATMAGAIAGALGGEAAVPAAWAKQVAEASRLDLHAPARSLAAVAREVFARDRSRRRSHESAFTAISTPR